MRYYRGGATETARARGELSVPIEGIERPSIPADLEEQYRTWVHAWSEHFSEDLVDYTTRDVLADAHLKDMGFVKDFWRGFGSVLCIFPQTVTRHDVFKQSVEGAIYRSWLSVGRDFLSV